MKFSKKIVIGVILANFIFTGLVLYVFLRTGYEPSVLVGAWFSFTTIELWSLAGIKKTELKNEALIDSIIFPEGDQRGD